MVDIIKSCNMQTINLSENTNSPVLAVGIGKSGVRTIRLIEKSGVSDVDFKILIESTSMEELADYKIIFIEAELGDQITFDSVRNFANSIKELSILTIGLFTMPFQFDEKQNQNPFIKDIYILKNVIDSLIIVSGNDMLKMNRAISQKDQAAQDRDLILLALTTITSLAFHPGVIGLNYSEVYRAMANSGFGFITSGEASAEKRAKIAIAKVLRSSLTSTNFFLGAKSLLVRIISGAEDILIEEISDIINVLIESVDEKCEIDWDFCYDKVARKNLRITIIAIGYNEVQLYLPGT